MPAPAGSVRQAACRARQALGRAVARVEIDVVSTTALLVRCGVATADDLATLQDVEDALERLIAVLAKLPG